MEDYYEIITDQEADFLIDLYEVIKLMMNEEEKVTLKNISQRMNVSTLELTDYLAEILSIQDDIEKEQVQ